MPYSPMMQSFLAGQADFGRRSQVGVPLVVNEFQDKDFKTLFVGTIRNDSGK